MNWFLYDRDLRHERVKEIWESPDVKNCRANINLAIKVLLSKNMYIIPMDQQKRVNVPSIRWYNEKAETIHRIFTKQ